MNAAPHTQSVFLKLNGAMLTVGAASMALVSPDDHTSLILGLACLQTQFVLQQVPTPALRDRIVPNLRHVLDGCAKGGMAMGLLSTALLFHPSPLITHSQYCALNYLSLQSMGHIQGMLSRFEPNEAHYPLNECAYLGVSFISTFAQLPFKPTLLQRFSAPLGFNLGNTLLPQLPGAAKQPLRVTLHGAMTSLLMAQFFFMLESSLPLFLIFMAAERLCSNVRHARTTPMMPNLAHDWTPTAQQNFRRYQSGAIIGGSLHTLSLLYNATPSQKLNLWTSSMGHILARTALEGMNDPRPNPPVHVGVLWMLWSLCHGLRNLQAQLPDLMSWFQADRVPRSPRPTSNSWGPSLTRSHRD